MLFAEVDAPHLRAWIINRLANTTDADADVLADYVLALLRHEGDIDSVRKVFEEEIPDFLREDSAAFTEDVFQAVKYKSFLPGAPPPPAPSIQASHQIPQTFPPAYTTHHTPYAETPSAFSSQTYRNGSKKRSYRDLDAPDTQSFSSDFYGAATLQPPQKQVRRGSSFQPRGGRHDNAYTARGRGGYGASNGHSLQNGSQADFQSTTRGLAPPEYNPHQPFMPPDQTVDANSILENIQRLHELGAKMGLQMPQAPLLPTPVFSGMTNSTPNPHRRRRPCRDYETKGFCSRGERCQFEHGNSSIYVPSFAPPVSEEYDPNNATLGMLEQSGHPPKPYNVELPRLSPFKHREPKRINKRKGGRSAFSAEGPNSDKTNTKIVVENIPEEHFTVDAVEAFFSQFGTTADISLRPTNGSPKRVAIVTFDTWAAAHAAWKSPKVVFDNRFVKVYWFKDESQFDPKQKHANGARNGTADVEKSAADPEFDVEEFRRKQEVAQKTHVEKQQKREALDRERSELEEKRKDLISRQSEEKRKLQAKLGANGTKEDSISPVLTKATLDEDKPTQAEALRAKLALLEQEASSLGLDPDAAIDDSFSWPARGRGLGRRPYRGRGGYTSRPYRGGYGYRGRGGVAQDRHAAYAAFSLDNRPKIISLTGVDFTEPAKDEALRQFLLGIGEFTDISTDPSATHVTFKDRKTAEQFMLNVSSSKSIPGVEDAVEPTWVTSAPKPTGADSDAFVASGLEEEHIVKPTNAAEDGGAFGATDSRDLANMDYEGAEWDIS